LSEVLDIQIPCFFVLVVGAWGWRPHLKKNPLSLQIFKLCC
jgi:hypothetical protein